MRMFRQLDVPRPSRMTFQAGCRNCEYCDAGRNNNCVQNPFGMRDYGGGSDHPGGYATHVIVDNVDLMVKIPGKIYVFI